VSVKVTCQALTAVAGVGKSTVVASWAALARQAKTAQAAAKDSRRAAAEKSHAWGACTSVSWCWPFSAERQVIHDLVLFDAQAEKFI
jgi:signal recognition particle GTPase